MTLCVSCIPRCVSSAVIHFLCKTFSLVTQHSSFRADKGFLMTVSPPFPLFDQPPTTSLGFSSRSSFLAFGRPGTPMDANCNGPALAIVQENRRMLVTKSLVLRMQ